MHHDVAVFSGEQLANYHFGEVHPFGPDRHNAFVRGLHAMGLQDKVEWLPPVSCNQEWLMLFHTPDFVREVKRKSALGHGFLDMGDTPARHGIFEAACVIGSTTVTAVDMIMKREFKRAFIPIAGLHHGYRDHCAGFCVFNDCALAIEKLLQHYQLQRIVYVDIDAHHGDGVYYNYDSDVRVFIVDVHESGQTLYPGTGDADETGVGPAVGTKMNVPMPERANDRMFAENWQTAEDFIDAIEPEFIILQCGADAMKGDPITHMNFSEKSYQLAATRLKLLAEKHCEGRLLCLGGGGYNMDNIALAWPTVVKSIL